MLKPENVILGFCVPVTVEGYRRHIKEPGRHHFASMVSENERTYRRAIIEPFDDAQAFMRRRGACVENEVTLARLTLLMEEETCRCLILFAHVLKEQRIVEFYDGFKSFEQVIGAVPQTFSGHLDLCLCDSRELGAELRARRPALGPIKFVDHRVDFGVGMNQYMAFIKLLSEDSLTYFQAYLSIARGMRDRLG